MNASDNNDTAVSTAPEVPCSTFHPLDCASQHLDVEQQFLALVLLALGCAVLSLCIISCALTMLVHKLSSVWRSVASGKAVQKATDPNDARKGLLGSVKSSFACRGKAGGGKSKRTSFAEDTSCAAPRDVDEEDL
jgi:hypothetical protein